MTKDTPQQASNKDTEQKILNDSFDPDFKVLAFEQLEFSPEGAIKRKVTDTLSVRIYTDTGNTYVAEAAPGSDVGDPVWRVKRIDSSGNTLWADGNSSFDNVAENYLILTYL